MNYKKIFFASSVILVSFIAILFSANLISPGSYSHSEKYLVSLVRPELIARIENLKAQDTSIVIPRSAEILDHSDEFGNFHMYILIKTEVVHFFILGEEMKEQKSKIFLVGYNKGLDIGNWKLVNVDFHGKENTDKKRAFEKIVLDRLGCNYEISGTSILQIW